MSENNRRKDVDLLRFIGILLMIMGHVGFGGQFNKYIHAFHMPMWFILSGFFIKTNIDYKSFFVKKARLLLIPFFIWGG